MRITTLGLMVAWLSTGCVPVFQEGDDPQSNWVTVVFDESMDPSGLELVFSDADQARLDPGREYRVQPSGRLGVTLYELDQFCLSDDAEFRRDGLVVGRIQAGVCLTSGVYEVSFDDPEHAP